MAGLEDYGQEGHEAEADGFVARVEIEPNGWVLAVEGRWPASTFADFHLSPDAAPAVVVTIRSRGHELRNGRAEYALRLRTLVATKPLRVSVPGPPMNLVSLDERLEGDVRRVRLALSEQVHLDDEVIHVHFNRGWRTGLPAQQRSGANTSARLAELPSFQWAVPGLMRVTRAADMRIDLLVASGWAESRSAVAAVLFTATDGVLTNSFWQISPSSSSGWGDSLRCWGLMGSVLCDGLSSGPVTVHAELFPWIGASRRTGIGHSVNRLDSFGFSAERPLHLVWDPDETHMPEAHVYVDPVRGTAAPQLVTVATTLEAARAGMPARSPSVAAQAVYLANRTVPAANGWPASVRAGDNAIITLAPGAHDFGTQAVTLGASTTQGRMILQGDPAQPDPKADCALALGLRPTWRYNALLLRNFRLLIGGTSLPFSTAVVHLQGMEVTARPGFETSQSGLYAASSAGLLATMAACKWHKTAVALRGASMRIGLVRGCQLSRSVASPVLVGNDRIDEGHDSFRLYNLTIAGNAALGADQMMWGNRVWASRTTLMSFAGVPDSMNSKLLRLVRFRMVNNLFEMVPPRGKLFNGIGRLPTSRNFGSVGEGTHLTAIDCLVEGNSFVGQRFSWGYNDPPTMDLTLQNRHHGNHFRNNYTDRSATKHDDISDAVYGRRPGFIECWSITYGVGHGANLLALRWGNIGDFRFEFDGLGVIRSPYPGLAQGNIWARFRDDRSQFGLGSDQLGFGDYTPGAGSPMRGMCHRANIDVDCVGTARSEVFAAGCMETPADN